jgi:hypothetical protein
MVPGSSYLPQLRYPKVTSPEPALDARAVYLVDEINEMESLSSTFVKAGARLRGSGRPFIANGCNGRASSPESSGIRVPSVGKHAK